MLCPFLILLVQLSELKKVSSRMVEAEKGKVYAEAENRILEERFSELSKKQSTTVEKLREAEMLKRLLETEARSSKNEVQELEEQKAALETRVAEVERCRIEREEKIASLELQLSEAGNQKQTVEEELNGLRKEMGELRER